jgi:hypothetical protein
MTIPVLVPEQHWTCPSCTRTDVTKAPLPVVVRLHRCAGHRLLQLPMIEDGVRAVHVVREAEDYVSGRNMRTDAEGRPVTHVETIRDDGQDATVYPAPAIAVVTPAQFAALRRTYA